MYLFSTEQLLQSLKHQNTFRNFSTDELFAYVEVSPKNLNLQFKNKYLEILQTGYSL